MRARECQTACSRKCSNDHQPSAAAAAAAARQLSVNRETFGLRPSASTPNRLRHSVLGRNGLFPGVFTPFSPLDPTVCDFCIIFQLVFPKKSAHTPAVKEPPIEEQYSLLSKLYSQLQPALDNLLEGVQEIPARRHRAECGLEVGGNLVQSDITRGGRPRPASKRAFCVRTCRVGVFVCAVSEELKAGPDTTLRDCEPQMGPFRWI